MSEDIIYYGIKIVLGIHTDRLPVVHLFQIQLKQLLTLMSLNGEQEKSWTHPEYNFCVCNRRQETYLSEGSRKGSTLMICSFKSRLVNLIKFFMGLNKQIKNKE